MHDRISIMQRRNQEAELLSGLRVSSQKHELQPRAAYFPFSEAKTFCDSGVCILRQGSSQAWRADLHACALRLPTPARRMALQRQTSWRRCLAMSELNATKIEHSSLLKRDVVRKETY